MRKAGLNSSDQKRLRTLREEGFDNEELAQMLGVYLWVVEAHTPAEKEPLTTGEQQQTEPKTEPKTESKPESKPETESKSKAG